MKHPALYYIKYLILTCDDIEDVYEDFRISDTPPDTRFVERARDRLDLPDDYEVGDTPAKTNKSTMRFLQKERVDRMFFPDAAVETCLELVDAEDPELGMLRKLLLGGLSGEKLEMVLKKKGFARLTMEIVEAYRHFFFNTNIMTPDDWKEYYGGNPTVANTCGNMLYALYNVGMLPIPSRKQMLEDGSRILYETMIEASIYEPKERVKVVAPAHKTQLATYKTVDKLSDDVADLLARLKVSLRNEENPDDIVSADELLGERANLDDRGGDSDDPDDPGGDS